MRAFALVVLLAASCAPPPEPPTPFRVAPSGPGLDASSGGRLVELLDEEGAVVERARFGSLAARAYTPDAVRVARLRPEGSGWALVDREATPTCVGAPGAEGGFTLQCGDALFEGRASDDALTLLRGRSVLGVVRRDSGAAIIEPLARAAIRCETDGTIEGSERVARARVPGPPLLSCMLATSLAADEDPDGTDVALAWFVWRAFDAPVAAVPVEGSTEAVRDVEGSGAAE